MSDDLEALVETVREELVHEHDETFCYTGHHRLSKCGLEDARNALARLAQRLADAERERIVAEHALDICNDAAARLVEQRDSTRRMVEFVMQQREAAEARATRAEEALRAAPALVGPNVIGDQAWCDPFVLGAFCNAYNAWAEAARAALTPTEEPEHGA